MLMFDWEQILVDFIRSVFSFKLLLILLFLSFCVPEKDNKEN